LGGKNTMWNLDELAIGTTFLAAIAGVMMLNNIKAPDVAIAPAATAAIEQPAATEAPMARTISFTVTGKRMPAECKGEPASDEIAARCEALRDRTVVQVR
jgi:hypothetical protein